MGNRCLKRSSDDNSKPRVIVPNVNVENDGTGREHPNSAYSGNRVRTTKYTVWTFLFLNFYEQCHRFANVYFIFIVILNFMPEIYAFAKEVAPIPVLTVLACTAIKDAFEDFRRYRADKRVNQAKCYVYSKEKGEYVQTEWAYLRPGDFVKLKCNAVVPADVLVLKSSDASGICHVETANLDGESNLKLRQVVRGFSKGEFDPDKFNFDMEVEAPNMEIYKFHGALRRGDERILLYKENLLLRGCVLRNTDFVEGIVIYAGGETKAMLNNRGARFKRSKLERQINKDVIWCVIILIILCFTGALGSGIWLQSFPRRDSVIYLAFPSAAKSEPAYHGFLNFWTFLIIFQAMIPLPLYVSIEFMKLGQVFLIGNDIEMYDEASDKTVDVRAMNITEDLGQIQYIFSDKTGTLTENKMDFRRCTIGGHDYEHCAMSKASITDSTSPILDHEAVTDVTLDKGDTEMKEMYPLSLFSKAVERSDITPLTELDETLSRPFFNTTYSDPDLQMAQEFFLNLTICNTVVVSINKNDTMPSQPCLRKPKKRHNKPKKADTSSNCNSIDEDSMDDSTVGDSDGMGSKQRKKKRKEKPPIVNPTLLATLATTAAPAIPRSVGPSQPDSGFGSDHPRPNVLPPIPNSPTNSQTDPNTSNVPSLPGCGFDPLSTLPSFNMAQHLIGAKPFDESSDAGTMVSDAPTSSSSCPFPTQLLLDSYEAESPDEMALVKTACNYGWKLCQRGPEFVSVWLPGDGLQTINVLNILPFDSDRKCMSVIIRNPVTNEIVLYCKGADTSVFRLLRTSGHEEKLYVTTQDHLNTYARAGLRTLVMAKRVISEEEYAAWSREYHAADSAMYEREEKLLKVTKKIEKDLQLLGGTGIEDRLQDGVPDTILSLREAGINVWVLTGDKQETAINIAYSAKLISEDQSLIILNSPRKSETMNFIGRHLRDIAENFPVQVEMRQRRKRPRARPELALCVDGDTLKFALDSEVQSDFLMLAEQCRSVICCRVTPHQKAEVVHLVKSNLQMQTLAIGDGANDVNMIQTADIGVGISGQEGMQAVMASDFAMARFRFLKRLLLVHGHWSYKRFATMALHTFYKDAIFIFIMFWYQLFNGFSGSVMFDQLYQIFFNLTMTSLPPIVLGIFDKDVNASTLMNNPCLYKEGQECSSYLPWHFWVNIGDAVWQSLVIFFVTYLFYVDSDIGIWSFGTILTFSSVLIALIMVGLETRSWTFLNWLSMIICFFIFWLLFAVAYNLICYDCALMDNPYYVIIRGMMDPVFWLTILMSVICALTPRLAVTAAINSCHPSLSTKARLLENKLGEGARLPLQPKPQVFSLFDHNNSVTNPRGNRVRPLSAPLRSQSMNQSELRSPQPNRARTHRRVQSLGEALRPFPMVDETVPETRIVPPEPAPANGDLHRRLTSESNM